MAKVVLVRPPSIISAGSYIGSLTPPIGLAYLAAALRHNNHQVTIVDSVGIDPEKSTYLGKKLILRGIGFSEILDLIPEDLDVFAIDVTLGVAQDLRWRHVYKYAVTDPSQKHEVRFIAGTRDFLQKNNAGIELFPDRYALSQNYPNPFNPQTSILLTMQDEAHVSLVVYNLLGEEVAVLANNEYRPAGYHNFIWKGLNKDNERVSSGVYFYMARVISPKGELLISNTHKMILVK